MCFFQESNLFSERSMILVINMRNKKLQGIQEPREDLVTEERE